MKDTINESIAMSAEVGFSNNVCSITPSILFLSYEPEWEFWTDGHHNTSGLIQLTHNQFFSWVLEGLIYV